jgi:acetoin:2,6-dichlorophenolindophenol oxidoreductase subunit alpha
MEVDRGDLALPLFSTMVRIRHFEERTEAMFRAGELPGFVHLSIGEEACAAGMCAGLRRDHYITSTRCGHGHTIAKGTPTERMMADVFGKVTVTRRNGAFRPRF